MLHTSAYDAAGSHTSLDALVAEVRILSQALQDVNSVAKNDNDGGRDAPVTLDSTGTGHRNLPSVPRDLVQYVEASRNPDIYTREFVELVRRTNQLRAGKRGAFAQFRDTLAGQIRSALPELGGDVDRIMEATAEDPAARGGEPSSSTGAGPAGPATAASTTSFDGSKTTVVGDGETPANTASGAAPPANLSASASPSARGSNQAGAGTPSGNSDAGPNAASSTSAPTTIDMMGILPSTPQPISSSGGGAPGAGAGGAATGGSGSGGQDSMETS